MGDENKLTIEGLSVEEYANISVASNDYWNDMITITGHDTTVDYDEWIKQYIDLELDYSTTLDDINNITIYDSSLGANDIKLTGGGEEMLRISQDGFYVNGVKVKQGKREAKAVYEAFKKWMTHAIMSGELNN
jgi:hypothetical protein